MVKILVDSGSDIEQDEANKLGVFLIAMEVSFGNETYLDGVDLSHKMFFEKLIESSELPKTSQINEYRFNEAFEELTEDGSSVVAITISSKLSGTYNSAVKASKNFAGKVFVVDSLNAAVGERLLAEYALRLANEGKTAEEIFEILNEKKSKIQLLAVLDTLKYLKKGGRISSLTAFAGELFSIKPVVSVIKGEVKMIGKAMGSKKGNNLLNQLIEKCGGVDFDMPFGLVYSGLSDELLQKYIKDSENIWKEKIKDSKDLPIHLIGSTIGTHIGPGAIAVAFFSK